MPTSTLYESTFALGLGQVPIGIVDPILHDELVSIHNAIAGLAQAVSDNRIFGDMYIYAEFVVAISDTSRVEVKDAAGDAWHAGYLNQVTFPTGGTEHYLTVPKDGKYLVVWSLSTHVVSAGHADIHAGVAINGTAIVDDGEAQFTHPNVTSTDSIVLASATVVDCPVGTEQISLWVSNSLTTNLHVTHGNVYIRRVNNLS